MRYMLDTNILIYLLKRKPISVIDKVNSLSADTQLCMSFFTYAELLKGADKSMHKTMVLRNLDKLIQQVSVVFKINKKLCEYYAIHFNTLKSAGTLIGGNDLWIACHALSEEMVLVTHNTREFKRIDGLNVEDWAV